MSFPFERLEGKYEIIEKMREGGMGAVYKVRHRLLEEIRVIKVMRPQLADDEVLRTRFLREAKTAIKLRHDNLAQIYDFAMDDAGTSFIVMEFIDGVSFHELLDTVGSPPLGLTLEIADQALDVLGYLHKRKIIHRDIAPDNLLLARDEDGRPLVKVIDLGIAKAPEAGEGLTKTGTFLGKVRYCSPEHFRTHEGAAIDARSDLYSFAVVLYELATGTHPIQGKSMSSLIAGHLHKEPVSFDRSDPDGLIPEDLRGVMLTALGKQPENRYQIADAFREALDPIRERTPISDDEVAALLEATRVVEKIPVARPGSTQDHLNRQFGLGATPPPLSEARPTTATPPPSSRTPHTLETAAGKSAPAPPAQHSTAPADDGAAQQVRALLLGADKLVKLEHFDEARLQLATALDIDPDNSQATELLAAVEAADTKRQAQRAQAVDEVNRLVAAGELKAAQAKLDAATGDLGTAEVFDHARAHIQSAAEEARKREALVKKRLETARSLVEKDRFPEAIEALREVLEIEADNTQARSLLERAEAAHAERLAKQRRAQEIADTCATIAAHLEAGAVDEGERALALATKLYGRERSFDSLRARLEQVRQQQVDEQAGVLRQDAADKIANNRFDEALHALDQAAALVPDDQRTADLVTAAREGQQRQEEERRRRQKVELAMQGVERLIAAGRLETALRTVDATVEEHGDFEEAAALRTQIENEVAERRQREAETWTLLERARNLAEAKNFSQAEKALGTARAFEAEHPEVHDLIEETEGAIRRKAEEHRRAQMVSEAVASIDRRIAAGSLEEAAQELEVAERLCGGQDVFDEIRETIDALVEGKRQENVQRLLQEALGRQASFTEVISKLEEALAIDPDNLKVQQLLSETRGALHRYEQDRRAAAIAEVMAEVDGLVIANRLDDALARLDHAVEEIGEFREARSARVRLRRIV